MAKDLKRRFTVSLDIDTKDAEKQIKSTVGNLKTILADMGKASDKMSYFRELVDYISQIDAALERLKNKDMNAFKMMFDGLDANLRTVMESIFGTTHDAMSAMDELRNKIKNLSNTGDTEGLKQLEQDVKNLYGTLGMKANLSGRGSFELRISKMEEALDGFAVVWENVNNKVKQGFGFGGIGGEELGNLTEKAQKEIEELEDKLMRLRNAIEDTEDCMKIIKQYSLGESVDGIDKTEKSARNTLETFKRLHSQMGEMKKIKSKDPLTFNEWYVEYSKVATQLAQWNLLRADTKSGYKTGFFNSEELKDFIKNAEIAEQWANKLNEESFGKKFITNLKNSIKETEDKINNIKLDRNNYESVIGASGTGTGTALDQAKEKLLELLTIANKFRNAISLDDVDFDSAMSELDSARKDLEELERQGELTEQQIRDVYDAITGAKTHLRNLSVQTDIEPGTGNGTGTGGDGNGSGTGTGSNGGFGDGTGPIDVDFTSLENTIRTEASDIKNKLNDILQVELVKDDTKDIQNVINGIKSSIDNISAHIDAYKAANESASEQTNVDNMKKNLLQLLDITNKHNAQKNYQGKFQDQELGVHVMSDGSIDIGFGEGGSVSWEKRLQMLLNNLSNSLIASIHTHPWANARWADDTAYANDMFSGAGGDLGNLINHKTIGGASASAMLTGDIMRIVNFSKLSADQLKQFRSELREVEIEYAKNSKYNNNIWSENGQFKGYISPRSLEHMHETSAVFESMMYDAFRRIGLSDNQINDEIFKKYNLTDDAQLTELATLFVNLSNAVQTSLPPLERLKEIIAAFGGDINSKQAKVALEGFNKGELTAADVVNELIGYKISNDAVSATQHIDSASQLSPVETLLHNISNILSAINNAVNSIELSSRQDSDQKYKSMIESLVGLKNGVINDTLINNANSIYDPTNLTEYKFNDVNEKAQHAIFDFLDIFNNKKFDFGGTLQVEDLQAIFDSFKKALQYVKDAEKQFEAYKKHTGDDYFIDKHNGEVIDEDYYDRMFKEITDFSDVLSPLMQMMQNAKDTFDAYKSQYDVSHDDTTYNENIQNDTELVTAISTLAARIEHLIAALPSINTGSVNYNDQNMSNITSVDNDNIDSEVQQLERLRLALVHVQQEINEKTSAFQNERMVVDSVVDSEIASLHMLKDALDDVSLSIHATTGAFRNNETAVEQMVNSEIAELRNLLTVLNDVQNIVENIVNGLNIINSNTQTSNQLPTSSNIEDSNVTQPIANEYALDSTLIHTNEILNQILNAIGNNESISQLVEPLKQAVTELKNVANGIVQFQKAAKTDTSVANARITDKKSHDHIRDIALGAVSDRAMDNGDMQVTGMTAMANGVVKVTGYVQTATDAWEGFTLQVNEANAVSKIAFDINAKAAKDAARAARMQEDDDGNPYKYNREDVEARAQKHIDEYTAQGKVATVQFKDSGRYTITILEEIDGLSKQIFQTFDENDSKIERTTATISNKQKIQLDNLKNIVGAGFTDNIINDDDDAYKKYKLAADELENMNQLYRNNSDLADEDILKWNSQIKLVQQLGSAVEKLINTRRTAVNDGVFQSDKRKKVATFNLDKTKLEESIDIPQSFVHRIKDAGDAIKNATDSKSMTIAINNWAALKKEIEEVAVSQDLYIKKSKTVATVQKGKHYGSTVAINSSAKYNSLKAQASSDEFKNSSVVANALQKYTDAYERLVAKRKEFASLDNVTDAQKVEFKQLTTECNNYGKALEKIIVDSRKLDSQAVNSTPYNLGEDFVDSIDGRKAALSEFVQSMYPASAATVEFKKNFNECIFAVDNGDGTFTNMAATFNAARTQIVALAGDTKKTEGVFESFFNEVKGKFKTISAYLISSFSIQEVWQQIRRGVEYVREIDSALTELKKVTNETDAVYDQFLQNMSKTAGVVGSTVSELTTMASEWSRLGYDIEEAATLAESTAILLNVSEFDDATAASQALISTMQAFQYTADESQHVVDILNEVGNNYAVSSDGIATALQDSASALMEGGNNLEQATALVAAANRVVQDPSSVGSALRTISLRLRGTSVEILEEMGEETDGVVESTSKLQEKLKALTGVDILTDSGAYKDTYTILKEIGAVWQDMESLDQSAALELMAGKNRANTLSAILNNMKDLEGAYNDALSAEGSALAENEAYLDSIQGRIDLFTNEIQTFWMNTVSSDMVKGIVNFGTSIVHLVDTIGLIPTALSGVLLYLTAIKKHNPVTMVKDLITGMQNYNNTIKQIQSVNSIVGQVDAMPIQQFNAGPVNAYAAAVNNLTATQQAATLAASGLNSEQIKAVLTANGLDAANIKLAMSEAQVAQAKTNTMTATGMQIAVAMKQKDGTISQNAANFLLAHSTEEVTKKMLAKAVVAGQITHQDAALIMKSMGVTAANNAQAFSWKALGTAMKAAFKSNPVGMILTIATTVTSILIPALNLFGKSAEKSAEKASDALNKYKEATKNLRDQKATIDELSDSYEKLSNGVDLNTNENISLTTESYQEYLDICNDIADMYPNLVTGFDAQGNAILSLKGNVDELIQSYKEAAQASRQELISKNYDIFNTFKSSYDSNPDVAWNKTGMIQQIKLAEEMQKLINDGTEDEIKDFFQKLNATNFEIDGKIYSNIERDSLFESAGINVKDFQDSWDHSIDIDKFKQQSTKLLSFIKSQTNKINTETSKVKSLMDAYLGEDLDYASLNEKSRTYINQIVSGLNAEFINGFDSADALYNWIKTNVVDAFKDQSVTDAISELSQLQFEFDKGDISYTDYMTQLNEYISKMQNKFDDETLAQIKIGVGIDEASLQTSINHIYDLLGGTMYIDGSKMQKISSMSVEDVEIAGQLEVPEGTLYTWDELLAKIEETKIAVTKDFDITNYTKSISEHSATISEYQEALQKLGKGSFTMDDFMSLIEKSPELAKGVDVSSNAFYGLSRNLNRAIKSKTKSFIKDLKELKISLEAAGKSTDAIDQLIEAIENMPEDALDDTIQKYSTLADKISEAKTAQDKLLASMEENPNEGYENRGEAMEYMKEAMEKGEIGSESNLWNVAEQYGFTYDSAKSINENADALAKFIATRERWFKTEDDGDDRTDDGYSYKGTENFIKDVESAVQNNAELQQYLAWDYDETTGILNFDYDNKNWDAIVSILSETKELAGLTSAEFADLLVQVGQYFGIEWGNYDDAVDHLNEIADGSDDAKTKVEEYGKYMQEYFGENTGIDLTARPMVSAAEMQAAGWNEFEEGDYATLYSGSYNSDDDSVTVSVTPILPDGKVLDSKSLEKYATEIANGADPAEVEIVYKDKKTGEETKYTGEDIFLNKFKGTNKEEQASKYGTKLSEAQAGYDQLRDTLGINTTLAEKGIDGLKEISELQGIVETNSKGVTVINEEAFTTALEEANYTEDQIDIIIEKIKTLNKEAFDVDFLKIDESLNKNGVSALKEIKELQGAIQEDADTGITVLDTDMFASALKDAGYTETQIDSLIKKIQEYNNVLSVSSNTDPLGLNNASISVDNLKASLNVLGIEYDEVIGKLGDKKKDLKIDVQDLVTTLKEKGWTDEAIRNYCAQLSETNLEGFNIKVNPEEIDTAIAKANEVPAEKPINIEITGDAYIDALNINKELAKMRSKVIDVTINETTVKKTKEAEANGTTWWNPFSWFADGTAHVEGTAHAEGSWGAPKNETALVGELGPELLVRNGRWTTVGENGAEFTQVKKGDIIFNHKQTEDLLSNGYVTSRGKAYASGTAFSSGGGQYSRYHFSGEGGYVKYDVNDNVLDSFGNAAADLSDAADDLSDSADEFNETFDWIEVRLEEINEKLSLSSAQLENAIGHTAQNAIIDDMIAGNKALYNNLIAGANEYYDYARKLLAKVPAEYRNAAQDGTIAIEEFAGKADEKTLEAIQEYREWVQKGADATQQAEETLTEISNLAKQAIDNIAQSYDNKTSLNTNKMDQLENHNAYIETTKGYESEAIYKALIEDNNKNIGIAESRRSAMQAELDKRVRKGEIKVGSQDWYDAVNDIAAVDAEIIQLKTDTESYKDEINSLRWEKFDDFMSQLESVSDEAGDLIDILETKDVVDELGNWTDEGIASIGLLAQQMEVAEVEAKKYEEAIDYLNKNWKKLGYTEKEYIEKLDELKSGQRDAIKLYGDTKEAIVDLNKERVDAIKTIIEDEIEAYEKLVEAKKEELSAEKDLFDFQKSTMQQQKNIYDIQRKLAALSGDNSASANAQRRQLQAELAEAEAELEDSYYNRSIENQQTALDKELENFQEEKDKEMEGWDKYLEDTNKVVSDSLALVQTNTDTVLQTLTTMGQEYGLSMSTALTSPWKDGETAIQNFSEKFGLSMSSTVEELEKLEKKYKETMDSIEESGKKADKEVDANAKKTQAAAPDKKKNTNTNKNDKKDTPKTKAIAVGGNVNAKGAKIYTHPGSQGYNQYYSSDPNYVVLGIDGNWVKVRHKSLKSGVTGFFKKSDLKAYAKGTKGVDKDQFAWIDELGEELQLVPDGHGRLAYIQKGTAILNADMTERLMNLAMDPQEMLDRNRPTITPSKSIINTEVSINLNIAEVVHVDTVTNDTMPDLTKAIEKQMDSYMLKVNNSLKRFAR